MYKPYIEASYTTLVFTSKSIIITLLCLETNPRNKLLQSIISFQLFFPEMSPKPNHGHVHLLTIDSRQTCRKSKFLSRRWRVIIWNTLWYHAIVPANIPHVHYGVDKFCITCRKLITNIELQYYVNLKANFNLDKFKNLSFRFDRQGIISIQQFFNVMGRKKTN